VAAPTTCSRSFGEKRSKLDYIIKKGTTKLANIIIATIIATTAAICFLFLLILVLSLLIIFPFLDTMDIIQYIDVKIKKAVKVRL